MEGNQKKGNQRGNNGNAYMRVCRTCYGRYDSMVGCFRILKGYTSPLQGGL